MGGGGGGADSKIGIICLKTIYMSPHVFGFAIIKKRNIILKKKSSSSPRLIGPAAAAAQNVVLSPLAFAPFI